MDYLLLQIFLFIILAAVIGFFIGWLTRGFGFESQLLASENQWRSRQHILQTENNRLQAELDQSQQKLASSTPTQQQADNKPEPDKSNITMSLPFKSNQNRQQAEEETVNHSHPLDRLRNELSQITEEHTPVKNMLEEPSETTQEEVSEEENIDLEQDLSATAPEGLSQPDGEADDLKTIKGIGPKIEATLNELGIYHFDQIASFSPENIDWVNDHLQFKGRIERESWVEQAQELLKNAS